MVKIQRHPEGTRVRVRRARLPLDPAREGKTGTVIHRLPGGERYGVQFDGESTILVFSEDEVEAVPRS